MKAAQAKFHAEIDRLDREVAMFHGVPLATFSDDAGVSASEDGLSFSFDRTIEDLEPLHSTLVTHKRAELGRHLHRSVTPMLDWPSSATYLNSAYPAPQPARPRRRPCRTAAVAAGAAVSAVIVAAWTLIVAGWCFVRDRYRGWRDAPLRAREAQQAELAAIRASAAEEARFAADNDMPMSAEAWRLLAADETYRVGEGDDA